MILFTINILIFTDNLIREIDIIKSIVDKIIKQKKVFDIFRSRFTAANTKFNGKKILGLNLRREKEDMRRLRTKEYVSRG